MGRRMQVGIGENRDSRRIFGYWIDIGGVRTTLTVDGAVYRTDRHASVNLVYHNQYGQPRRREQNTI